MTMPRANPTSYGDLGFASQKVARKQPEFRVEYPISCGFAALDPPQSVSGPIGRLKSYEAFALTFVVPRPMLAERAQYLSTDEESVIS